MVNADGFAVYILLNTCFNSVLIFTMKYCEAETVSET